MKTSGERDTVCYLLTLCVGPNSSGQLCYEDDEDEHEELQQDERTQRRVKSVEEKFGLKSCSDRIAFTQYSRSVGLTQNLLSEIAAGVMLKISQRTCPELKVGVLFCHTCGYTRIGANLNCDANWLKNKHWNRIFGFESEQHIVAISGYSVCVTHATV